DMARISRDLVTLKNDVDLDIDVMDLTVQMPNAADLIAFLKENEFKQLTGRAMEFFGASFREDVAALPNDDPVEADTGTAKIEDVHYTTILDMDTLDFWIKEAERVGQVAVDTETTSLNAMQASLVGISLSIHPGRACYIPVGHVKAKDQGGFDFDGAAEKESGDMPQQLPKPDVLAALKPLLEDPGVLKIGQNIKYDLVILSQEGINVAPVDDTMLLSYCQEAGLHGHGMDELSELHFSIKPIPFKEVAGTGKSQITFAEVPIDKATEYAAEDADITLRLHQVLKRKLVQTRAVNLYETIERPLVPVIARMEQEGVKVDARLLSTLSTDFGARMEGLVKEIHDLAGQEFNVGSPKQLGEILFDKMGLSSSKKGKTGAYTTDVNVLEGLAADGVELAHSGV
ncbi:MAG: DNA polymerase, partial [Sneathiella sp.]